MCIQKLSTHYLFGEQTFVTFCENMYYRRNIHTVFRSWLTNYYQYRENIYLRLSNNSEAFASELLENLEEVFPRYYMYCDVAYVTVSTKQQCVICLKSVAFKWKD